MERMNGIEACEIIVSMENDWLKKSQEKLHEFKSGMKENSSVPLQ